MYPFGVSSMYTKIPTRQVTNTIKIILNNQNRHHSLAKEMKDMTRTILLQKYFKLTRVYNKREEWLSMEVPSSAILAQIFYSSKNKITYTTSS
jgi:hypothetical protein